MTEYQFHHHKHELILFSEVNIGIGLMLAGGLMYSLCIDLLDQDYINDTAIENQVCGGNPRIPESGSTLMYTGIVIFVLRFIAPIIMDCYLSEEKKIQKQDVFNFSMSRML